MTFVSRSATTGFVNALAIQIFQTMPDAPGKATSAAPAIAAVGHVANRFVCIRLIVNTSTAMTAPSFGAPNTVPNPAASREHPTSAALAIVAGSDVAHRRRPHQLQEAAALDVEERLQLRLHGGPKRVLGARL